MAFGSPAGTCFLGLSVYSLGLYYFSSASSLLVALHSYVSISHSLSVYSHRTFSQYPLTRFDSSEWLSFIGFLDLLSFSRYPSPALFGRFSTPLTPRSIHPSCLLHVDHPLLISIPLPFSNLSISLTPVPISTSSYTLSLRPHVSPAGIVYPNLTSPTFPILRLLLQWTPSLATPLAPSAGLLPW